MTANISGEVMVSRETLHDELARALELPDYYGRNLDALWDLISCMNADVTFTDRDGVIERLGRYGKSLIRTLEDAQRKNPDFHIEFIGK